MVLRTSNPSAGSICTVTRSKTWSFRVFVQSNYKKVGLTMKFTVLHVFQLQVHIDTPEFFFSSQKIFSTKKGCKKYSFKSYFQF